MKLIAQADIDPVSTIPVLTIANPSAAYSSNGVAITPVNGKYYLDGTRGVNFTIDLIDSESNLADVDISLIKLVAERQSDDRPNGEEIYLTGSINGGILNVAGQFGVSTNWKITAARNNRALDRLFAPGDAPFHLDFEPLDFLA